MKRLLTSTIAIMVVLTLSIGAVAASALLTGNRFDNIPVAAGTFGVGTPFGAPSVDPDLLAIDGWSTTEPYEFVYVENVKNLQLGEFGLWSDGVTEASPAALWTVSLNDPSVEAQDLCFRLRLTGPAAEEAAKYLVIGCQTNDNDFLLYTKGEEEMAGDGPWYNNGNPDQMETPDIWLGTITQDTSLTLILTAMSMATAPIDGEFTISVDIYPAPYAP